VDIWQWRLDHGAIELLSADERARAGQFMFDRDRRRYIAARARLRIILARYVGQAPAALQFHYGPHGKPALDGISFNLSHSADLALLAVSRGTVVGVDIERVRPIAGAFRPS
jgi:4'-phosphopantetheinyl transferase